MPDTPDAGEPVITALAFDFGTRHIGLAVGQSLTCTANPVGVIPARDGQPDWAEVARHIADWAPDLLLVGLPLNMDGSESELSTRARKFARRLQGRLGLTVKMMDERLSTREAKAATGQRRRLVDAQAAQLILQTWLEEPERALLP